MIMVNCLNFLHAHTNSICQVISTTTTTNVGLDFEILIMKIDKRLQLLINYVIKIIYKVNKTILYEFKLMINFVYHKVLKVLLALTYIMIIYKKQPLEQHIVLNTLIRLG